MKKMNYITAFTALLFAVSCSDTSSLLEDEKVEVKEISTSIGSDTGIDLSTRVGGVVLSDPTTTPISVRGGLGWNLDVQIYNSTTAYAPGKNTYVYGTGSNWISQTGVKTYFPNYTSQFCEFTMYATSPTETIPLDQSSADVMLHHDKLYIKTMLAPAHILSATLKHAQSMLDFSFEKTPSNIVSVTVQVGSDIYTPYRVPATYNYLLILPSGVSLANPIVIATTDKGTTYKQVVKVGANPSALGVNYRYIFKLTGFNLVLSPITIVDWITGGMLGGDYVGEIAYPTFRGPASTSCTLTFDNGLTQVLTFNSRGECTVKANGRTIVQINSVPQTIVLGSMIIDLNPYLIP